MVTPFEGYSPEEVKYFLDQIANEEAQKANSELVTKLKAFMSADGGRHSREEILQMNLPGYTKDQIMLALDYIKQDEMSLSSLSG